MDVQTLAAGWWAARRAGFSSTAEMRIKPGPQDVLLADEADERLGELAEHQEMACALLAEARDDDQLAYLLDCFRIQCSERFHLCNYRVFSDEVENRIQVSAEPVREQWQQVRATARAVDWVKRAQTQIKSLKRYWPDAPEDEVAKILVENGIPVNRLAEFN